MRLVLAVASLLLLASAAQAEVEAKLFFGHNGAGISGAVTPVVVRLKSRESKPLFVSISAQSGVGAWGGELLSAEGFLSPHSTKDFRFHLRSSANQKPQVNLRFDRAVVILDTRRARTGPTNSFQLETAPADVLMGGGGEMSSPNALQVLAVGAHASMLPSNHQGIRVVPVLEDELPEFWHGYDGLDVVYLRNPFVEKPMSDVAQAALLRWVELGGTLVVSATLRPDLLTGTQLGDALPAKIGSPTPKGVSYRRLARELARDNSASIRNIVAEGPFVVLTPRGDPPLLHEGDIEGQSQLIEVAGPRGLGWISVLAFDPARYQGVEGTAASGVLIKALGFPFEAGRPEHAIEKAVQGIDEYPIMPMERDYLSGLIRVLKTGAVKAPPILLLSFFMLLYVLAVGPLDYFFLKRRGWLKYSALSFMILAVAFSATAWFVSFYLFAGGEIVNRVTVVDVVPDPAGSGRDLVLMNDFAGYYEPRGGTISLEVEATTSIFSQLAPLDVYLSWGSGSLGSEAPRVDCADPARQKATLNVPFRSLRTARMLALREEALDLAVTRTETGGFTVRNGLPYALRDAVIFGPDGRTSVVNVAPGAECAMGRAAGSDQGQLPNATQLSSDPENEDRLLLDALGPFFCQVARHRSSQTASTPLGRTLWKSGLAQPEALSRGVHVLMFWTDARDPFRLPGGGEEGFRITVVRRVIDR
jgi:hypothetical protein